MRQNVINLLKIEKTVDIVVFILQRTGALSDIKNRQRPPSRSKRLVLRQGAVRPGIEGSWGLAVTFSSLRINT